MLAAVPDRGPLRRRAADIAVMAITVAGQGLAAEVLERLARETLIVADAGDVRGRSTPPTDSSPKRSGGACPLGLGGGWPKALRAASTDRRDNVQ